MPKYLYIEPYYSTNTVQYEKLLDNICEYAILTFHGELRKFDIEVSSTVLVLTMSTKNSALTLSSTATSDRSLKCWL